jgi:replication factor C subunit 3/5
MNNSPWVEKYRPKEFDNIVLNSNNKIIFKNIINEEYFPNLLFYGPPGTGKTTTIINLINDYQKKHYTIDKSLVIHLNASDERGIDIIRNQINTFVKSNHLFNKGMKFVILDEVDYMTKNAQQALKYLLQSCNDNVKFCLICNYISKVDESLRNEFLTIRFNQLPPNDIFNFVKNISISENLKLSDEIIQSIQNIYGSDIRSIINFIQLNQNMDFEDWKNNVINNGVFENIHSYLLKDELKELQIKINDISRQYNIEKRSLIIGYFDFIIRNKKNLINNDLLQIIQNISHDNSLSNYDMINYFCCSMKELLK